MNIFTVRTMDRLTAPTKPSIYQLNIGKLKPGTLLWRSPLLVSEVIYVDLMMEGGTGCIKEPPQFYINKHVFHSAKIIRKFSAQKLLQVNNRKQEEYLQASLRSPYVCCGRIH